MVSMIGYMLRDRKTGRWHNWGGLTEWLPDSPQGGTIWTDKEKAEKFAREYKVCDVEVVPVLIQELPPCPPFRI
jgi:hypothetical protein